MLQRLIGNAAEVVGGGRHDQRQPLKLLGRDLIWVLVGIPRIDPGGSQMEFSGNDQQELFQGQLFGNVLRPHGHPADDNIRIVCAQALQQQLVPLLNEIDPHIGIDLVEKRQQLRHPRGAVHQADADVEGFFRMRHLLKLGGQPRFDLTDLFQLLNAQRTGRRRQNRRF